MAKGSLFRSRVRNVLGNIIGPLLRCGCRPLIFCSTLQLIRLLEANRFSDVSLKWLTKIFLFGDIASILTQAMGKLKSLFNITIHQQGLANNFKVAAYSRVLIQNPSSIRVRLSLLVVFLSNLSSSASSLLSPLSSIDVLTANLLPQALKLKYYGGPYLWSYTSPAALS
jgi:hypothetical protein